MKIHIGEKDDTTNFITDKYLTINSCGIQENNGNEYMLLRSTGRKDYHILYIEDGVCFAFHKNKEYELKKGDFILYFPNEPQKYRFPKNFKTTTFWIHFTGKAAEEIMNDANLTSGVYFSKENDAIKSYFKRIITFSSLNNPYYSLQANGCLLNLVSILSLNDAQDYNSAYPNFIIDAIKYINFNWQKNIDPNFLAEQSHLSQSRFSHLFKYYTGQSCLSYLKSIKLKKAKELLISTDMSISEISNIIGYPDALYFSRIFKKATKVSPLKYRKIHTE